MCRNHHVSPLFAQNEGCSASPSREDDRPVGMFNPFGPLRQALLGPPLPHRFFAQPPFGFSSSPSRNLVVRVRTAVRGLTLDQLER